MQEKKWSAWTAWISLLKMNIGYNSTIINAIFTKMMRYTSLPLGIAKTDVIWYNGIMIWLYNQYRSVISLKYLFLQKEAKR